MPAATAVVYSAQRGAFVTGEATLDPGSILTEANEDFTIPVPEAEVGDVAIVNPSAALLDGLIISNPHVSAAGTITATLENNSGSTRDQTSLTIYWALIKGQSGPYT